MKYRDLIRSAFEQEEQKESMHIEALEKQILLKIHEEESLDKEMKRYFQPKRSFWDIKIPYALAIIVVGVLLISVTTVSVSAKGSVMEMLINLRNALQQELSNLLNNDPSFRDKGTQKYQQAQEEWCLLSARPPEQREIAVAAIRDFLDRPGAKVEYECIVRNPNKPDERPTLETYTVDFDLFVVDIKTNKITEMSPKQGTWGENKDGTRWFSPQKEYDYTPRYTQVEAEKLARDFIANHEKALGRIDLSKLTLEVSTKNDEGKVNYFFIWKDKPQTHGGNLFTPQLTVTYTQGGQLVAFLNELSLR